MLEIASSESQAVKSQYNCLVSDRSGLYRQYQGLERDNSFKPVFSTLIGPGISMFCSHWLNLDHSVAPPALLCHKEPAPCKKCP